jgi:ankyrin repeat protein
LAAAHGHKSRVRLLLRHKDVLADARDVSGWLALSKAAEQGHDAVVKVPLGLKDANANPKAMSRIIPLALSALKRARGGRDNATKP